MGGRVLVVTYYFPPSGGIGYERTLKYATYLPRWGWQATVLTVKDAGYGLRDPESTRRVPPDLDVVRTRSSEPAKLRRGLGRVTRSVTRFGRSDAGAKADVAAASAPAKTGNAGSRWVGRTWQAVVTALFFPDAQLGWVPYAVRAGTAAVRRSGAQVVYSTSSPISSHLVGGLIARRTKLPWVADFRDPWIGNAFAPKLPRWQRPLQRRLERWIVRHAARVVFVSDEILDGYRARYPWAADRFTVIPNGYDLNDLVPHAVEEAPAASEAAPAVVEETANDDISGRFKLAYGGSVYGEHELEIFLDGLELLLRRRPDLRDRLAVEFIGWLTLHNQAVAARYDTPERLGSIVSYTGFLTHDEALARLARADALFNVIADEPEKWRISSGKLTEYIGLDRQIIAFVPEGAARDLLRELDWGVLADPTPQGVADGIERLLVTPRPDRRADPEGRYDRVNLAARLAAVLDAVTEYHAAGLTGTADPGHPLS